MSRRASVFARLNPGKRRVRFPDEVVFEDHIKESDGDAIMNMLRRASVDIDLDRINMAGMTALHQVSSPPASLFRLVDPLSRNMANKCGLIHTFHSCA